MVVYEVANKKMEKEFIELPRFLYKKDPAWICNLDTDLTTVFNPYKNEFYHHGKCTRWILMNDNRQTIGRIAAFIDFDKTRNNNSPHGGMGFFECINNIAASFYLFDTAKNWLKDNGIKSMYGPINFGENDKFWGLLVQGFKEPSYGMNYNPPYYSAFFERYGFIKAYDQLTNVLNPENPLPERFTRISEWVMNKPEYSFCHFRISEKDQFFSAFQEIYNDAWRNFEDFTPIDIKGIQSAFRQMKPIMDEKFIWFSYYKNEPIAFVICLPDVNQILKHLKGRMHWYNKIKFLWLKNTKKVDRLRITVMGCKHKFQNHGIESALIRCLKNEVLPRHTIKEVELAWVGDFNSKMLALHTATGATTAKVHRTYRLTFD